MGGKFVDYDLKKKKKILVGKMATVNVSDLQNLKHHKIDSLRNTDLEISARSLGRGQTFMRHVYHSSL